MSLRCLNCGRKIGKARARGLCHPCHGDLTIRAKYPPISPMGNRQRGDRCAQEDSIEDPPLAPTPTQTEPQTPERVEVMRDRDSNGFHVEHPRDKGHGSGIRGQEESDRVPPMWRAILPSGVVVAGIFAPTKSEARSEVKKRLKLSILPSGTRIEQVRKSDAKSDAETRRHGDTEKETVAASPSPRVAASEDSEDPA